MIYRLFLEPLGDHSYCRDTSALMHHSYAKSIFSLKSLVEGEVLHYWLFCCVFTVAGEAIEIENRVLFEWLLGALQCSSAGAGSAGLRDAQARGRTQM